MSTVQLVALVALTACGGIAALILLIAAGQKRVEDELYDPPPPPDGPERTVEEILVHATRHKQMIGDAIKD